MKNLPYDEPEDQRFPNGDVKGVGHNNGQDDGGDNIKDRKTCDASAVNAFARNAKSVCVGTGHLGRG